MATDPSDQPTITVTPCGGTGVLAVLALIDHRVQLAYPACPGCPDCDRETVRARLLADLPADRDPFAGLPTVDDGEAW